MSATLLFVLTASLIGLILGPLAEQQLRRALAISKGDMSVFLTQPLSAALLAIAAAALIGPILWRWRRGRRTK